MSLESNKLNRLMKLMPITYSSTLFKQIFVLEPSQALFTSSSELIKFNKMLGNAVYFGSYEVPYTMYLIILSSSAALFFVMALVKIKLDNK